MKVLTLNVCVLTGIGLMVSGIWMMYVPAAYVVAGVGLLYVASGVNRQHKAK